MARFELKKLLSTAVRRVKSHRAEAALCAAVIAAVLAVAILSLTAAPGGGGEHSADGDRGDAPVEPVDATEYIGTVLAATAPADGSYVDETLFVGDSNTYRFMMYGQTTLKNCIGIVGMGVLQFGSERCVTFEGKGRVTIPEAIAIMQPRRVVLTFGTNDFNLSVEKFIEGYEKLLDSVQQAYPYADVIINAVPPVARERLYTDVTMETINAFNTALVELAERREVYFLNSTEVLLDPATGYMIKDYTLEDGIHLSKKSVDTFFEYVKTHALDTEDTRPALKPVPARDEPEPYIISGDIKYYTDKVELEFTVNDDSLGSISGDTMQSVKAGEAAEAVTAVPREGCRFVRWECTVGSIASPQDAGLVFRVPAGQKESIVITAVFEPESSFAVEIASDTGGCGAYIISGGESVSRAEVKQGESVEIRAYPAEGYTVEGMYSGDVCFARGSEFTYAGGGYVCRFKPLSDVRLTVRFAPALDPSSLVTVEPAGAASVSARQSDSTITFSCTPSDPAVYGFDGWYVNGAFASSDSTLTVRFSEGLSVRAALHPHTFGPETVTRPPSATETGEARCSCTVCGAEKTVTLPATGGGATTPDSPDLPDTPDPPDLPDTPDPPDLPTPDVPDTPDPPDLPTPPTPDNPGGQDIPGDTEGAGGENDAAEGGDSAPSP